MEVELTPARRRLSNVCVLKMRGVSRTHPTPNGHVATRDTTFLIDVLNYRRGRADEREQMIAEQHMVACCAINVAEVYVGLRSPMFRFGGRRRSSPVT